MKNRTYFLSFLIVLGMIFCFSTNALSVTHGQKINLNTATAEQLTQLNHIGPAIADRIVADREKNGPYKTIDGLLRVKGIGPKTLAAIRDQITVDVPEKMKKPEKE